jgi:uncharacterized protein
MKLTYCLLAMASALNLHSLSSWAESTESPDHHPRPLPPSTVEICDAFWAPKLRVYREVTIPHSWRYLETEIRSVRKAAGQKVEGELNGTWGEANLYKFLETVAYSLALHPDAGLERQVDQIVVLLAAAQQPDGYLHAYVTNNKKVPWDPNFLDGSHDGYVLGHMIQAALAYQAATGNGAFREVACKAADQAYQHFLGPDGHPGFCGHAELEMALVELFRATHEPRYLELARAFVEWRGRGTVKPFGATPRSYFQDAVPLRSQRTLEGHAVRALFFATGVADLALETGDGDYRLAANRFWDSTTLRRMTLTGSVGPRKEHEAFGEDYELPNDGYYESCAACGLADFAQRMFLLERRTESVDVLERVLYNAVLHGISLSGTNTYYCNPLSDHDHERDNCWVCCPPNLSRTLLKLGTYAYASTDRDLYVNLLVGSVAHVRFPSGEITLRVRTDYPWDGRVSVGIAAASPVRFAIHVRKPGWCAQGEVKLNGAVGANKSDDRGYWTFEREWKDGDSVEVNLDMPVQRIIAHPNIISCRDKTAFQRGPLVYGFEGVDNGTNLGFALASNERFSVTHRPDLLGGVTVLQGRGANGRPILAIPYYAMANRGKSTQEVWVGEPDLKVAEDWWPGTLYRPAPLELKNGN